MKRQSVKLQDSDWERLNKIASQTGSVYMGKASWRRLLGRVARGELVIGFPAPAPAPVSAAPAPAPVFVPIMPAPLGDDFIRAALQRKKKYS